MYVHVYVLICTTLMHIYMYMYEKMERSGKKN